MTDYALVSPADVVDRIQSDSVIDPNTGTKPGWRWLKIVDQSGEPVGLFVEANRAVRRTAAPVPQVPQTVTPRQARLALLVAGRLEDVEAAVAAGDEPTQIAWEYALEIRRDDPLVAALAAALGFDDAAMDALFTTAAGL